jgi:hypothetical protein
MEQELKLLINDKTKKLIFHCDAVDIKRLKQIALHNEFTPNALLLEGVRYILSKYENKKKNSKNPINACNIQVESIIFSSGN